MPYVKPSTILKEVGVHSATLRAWANAGKVKCIKGPGGGRLYDLDSILEQFPKEDPPEKTKYIYCRVSSNKQKEDLERQVKYLQEKYPKHKIVKEIASGINFKRKVLQKLVDESIQGSVSEIVVAHRDRLCRIAWEHFKWLFTRLGVNVVVDSTEECTQQSELTDDLLSIIHVFSCRHYGQRRKYTKKETIKSRTEEETEVSESEQCENEQSE